VDQVTHLSAGARQYARLLRGSGRAQRDAGGSGLVPVAGRQALRLAVRQEPGVRAAVVADRYRAVAEVDDLDRVRVAAVGAVAVVPPVRRLRRTGRDGRHLAVWLPHRRAPPVVAGSSFHGRPMHQKFGAETPMDCPIGGR
jgi:hypothetical protein